LQMRDRVRLCARKVGWRASKWDHSVMHSQSKVHS